MAIAERKTAHQRVRAYRGENFIVTWGCRNSKDAQIYDHISRPRGRKVVLCNCSLMIALLNGTHAIRGARKLQELG